MTPTYLFIYWMCIAPATTCQMWQTPNHNVVVMPESDHTACEAAWAETTSIPDPPGLISTHRCQPISEDL